MQFLKDTYEKAKAAIQGPAQNVADASGLSNINPPDVQPEAPNTTTTGGKRIKRRTTRRSKKLSKTNRGRKH